MIFCVMDDARALCLAVIGFSDPSDECGGGKLRKADFFLLFSAGKEDKGLGDIDRSAFDESRLLGGRKIFACDGGDRGVIQVEDADDVLGSYGFVVADV